MCMAPVELYTRRWRTKDVTLVEVVVSPTNKSWVWCTSLHMHCMVQYKW